MATATLPRHVKAAGILERQECTPVDAPGLEGLWHVTDTGTGSGRVHVTSATRCDCPDHNFRGHVCKHMQAVTRAEAELATYTANWDAMARPRCPMCGGSVSIQHAYIGGKGYILFSICDGEGCRHARPA